tara:strand:- start:1586 stop:1945 length:360 start_codon:yes stop_codon:yes gene_type:complete
MMDFLWVLKSETETLTPYNLESEELGRILYKGGKLPGLIIKNIKLWDICDPLGLRFVELFVSTSDLNNWTKEQLKLIDPEVFHDEEDFLYSEHHPPERIGSNWIDTYQLNIDQLVDALN